MLRWGERLTKTKQMLAKKQQKLERVREERRKALKSFQSK
jgi:hypothetical protein